MSSDRTRSHTGSDGVAFLEQVLPGFAWLSWRSFLVGLVESFPYGAFAGTVYVPIYDFFQRRWGDEL